MLVVTVHGQKKRQVSLMVKRNKKMLYMQPNTAKLWVVIEKFIPVGQILENTVSSSLIESL